MAKKKRLSETDREILKALSDGQRETPDLERIVGKSVYSRCRKLESLGLVQSKLGVLYNLFCVECWKVVTAENHADHEDHPDELRNIPNKVRIWSLTNKGREVAESG